MEDNVTRAPDATDAVAAVELGFGWRDATARRFGNGLAFYVFDVDAGGERAVVRMGLPGQRRALRDGVALSRALRPLGVPLPALLFDGTEAALPYVIIERFAGTDLGDVFAVLGDEQRRAIARQVAAAQMAVGRLGPAQRFGYAASAEAATHGDWAVVVQASIARSQGRIMTAGLFDPEPAEQLSGLFDALAPQMRAIAATPFLHDTTTKNVIVTRDGVLSGIVDVDDLCFGDPRYAAALTATALLTRRHDLDYVSTWLDAMGLADDALFRFYIAVFLLDFMSEHGMVFNGNMRPSRAEDRQHLLTLFEAAASAVR